MVDPNAPKIPNYLVQSIMVTVCCCQPFGIVAIIMSSKVNSLIAAGDYDAAEVASENAKKWCWIGFGLGLIVYVIAIALQVVAGIAAQS